MKENGTYHDGLEPNNLPASLRKNPFGLPENYFNDLESKIITQVKLVESKDTVFEVPEGYFDNLSETIMCKIAENNLKSLVIKDGFEIPENYSSELSVSILSQISEDALKEKVSSDGFAIPYDYNRILENSIFSRIAERELKDAVLTDGFVAPVDYEKTLESTILSRIAEEKLRETVGTTNFDVPPHYFENLSDRIINAVQEVEKDVTPIHRIGKPKKWYARYAVAASFAAMLSIGGYWGYQYLPQDAVAGDGITEEQLSQHLSEIPKQEIINYLAASASGDDMIYMSQYTDEANLPTKGFGSNLSKQEIEDYLNYTL
ncbi:MULTISPECIES: hypothetical protein [unclassified Sphingobacterium]|uniref:hypothetical protein n=1 Tax=unclassified Sphingobacterium TaxID=2609468 RepID=UPI0025DBFEA3|nr:MULTISPECIES: hypothetical protein [unclassified Sphingobacterium]